MLGEYVRTYDARILQIPGMLFARLSHGGPNGDHPVLGLLGPHSLLPTGLLYHAPSPVLLADPGCVMGRGDQICCSPARRHPRVHFTSGTREAPPARLLTSRLSFAYLVARGRHRERVGPPSLSKRKSRCGQA